MTQETILIVGAAGNNGVAAIEALVNKNDRNIKVVAGGSIRLTMDAFTHYLVSR
jgi:hypothetical protein